MSEELRDKKNPSYIASIGDAIVALVNESTLATAERTYSAEVKLKEVGDVPVLFVRPSALESPQRDTPHSRGHRFIDIPYDMMLVGHVDGYDISDVDEVLAVYEQIDQFLYESARITSPDYGYSAQWYGSSPDVIVNTDMLRNQNLVHVTGQVVYRHQT